MQPVLITLMALGTVALDTAFIIAVVAVFKASWRAKLMRIAREYGLLALFILATLSVAGTLWMQYGDNLNPCLLCWWQRIFMYPIAIISFLAILKGKQLSDIADYALTFSILGAAVALYQHLLQVLPAGALIPCDASGDCAVRTVFEFGFVTLPWMALSVFVVLALLTYLGRRD